MCLIVVGSTNYDYMALVPDCPAQGNPFKMISSAANQAIAATWDVGLFAHFLPKTTPKMITTAFFVEKVLSDSFARNHESLRIKPLQSVQRKGRQQSVAAGLTRHRWSMLELISYPLL